MIVLKCKMCGGDMLVSDDKTFGTCEYCGSTATLPKVDNEQRAAAFNRGNHFRRIGEFDKALAVYERIVREDDGDAEAHWCCALCRFGIEYVEDPNTYEWIPTCHRTSFDSILDDVDYKAAVEYSDGITQRQYQKEAIKIAEVQKGILATSQTAEPFDIFISYKETDEAGNRTKDSVLAQDIYYQLTEQGYRVFFSRITLEEVVGKQYEPYIFAALNSAKVMIVVGTQEKHLNAPWVKNEWSRFLVMMKHDRTKVILPCYRDMDPYDLPEQLSVLQSYDMSKIGFIQELTRGILKILGVEKHSDREKESKDEKTPSAVTAETLIERGFMALEDREWKKADEFFENALNMDSQNAKAYWGKTLAEAKATDLGHFIQKRKTLNLDIAVGDNSFTDEMLHRYVIPSFLDEKQIEKLLLGKKKELMIAEINKKGYEYEQSFWETDKNLRRAIKFATGALAKQLTDARDEILAYWKDEIIAAEKRQELTREEIIAEIEHLHREASIQRDDLYRESCELLRRPGLGLKVADELYLEKEQMYIQQLRKARDNFNVLGSYLDSKDLLEKCNELIAESEQEIVDIRNQIRYGEVEENVDMSSLYKLGVAFGVIILLCLRFQNC